MNNIYNEINHCQIINIADYLKTQKYTLNKQRGETIIKYVKQNQLKEERAKKVSKLLGLYQKLIKDLANISNNILCREYMTYQKSYQT